MEKKQTFKNLLGWLMAFAIAGTMAIWMLVWYTKSQPNVSTTDALPSLGDPLQSDTNLEGMGIGANSAPNASELQDYQKYQDAKGPLTGEIQKGDGAEAAKGKQVTINYTGYLTSSKVFDKSSNPFAFTVGQKNIIPGMNIGVSGMKVGGKRRVIIPPAFGYGTQMKPNIPPNSVLIFDIELLAVK